MFFFLYWYFYWPSSWFNCLCLFILLSQIWFSCSGIGRQVVSMCSASYWDLSEHAHTYTQKRNNLWNGPQHFSSTPFLGDSWGLFFFFSPDISCGQGVEHLPKGRGCRWGICFWFWFPVRPKAPWCIMTGPGSKCSFHVSSAVFLGTIYSYNLPHLTQPVESSQNHIHFWRAKQDNKLIWSSLCMRIKPPSLALKQYVIYTMAGVLLGACITQQPLFACMLTNVQSHGVDTHTGMLQLSFK